MRIRSRIACVWLLVEANTRLGRWESPMLTHTDGSGSAVGLHHFAASASSCTQTAPRTNQHVPAELILLQTRPAASHTLLLFSLLISSSVGRKSAAECSRVQRTYGHHTTSHKHIFCSVENRRVNTTDFLCDGNLPFSGHLCSLSARNRLLHPMFPLRNEPKSVPLILRQNLWRPGVCPPPMI